MVRVVMYLTPMEITPMSIIPTELVQKDPNLMEPITTVHALMELNPMDQTHMAHAQRERALTERILTDRNPMGHVQIYIIRTEGNPMELRHTEPISMDRNPTQLVPMVYSHKVQKAMVQTQTNRRPKELVQKVLT